MKNSRMIYETQIRKSSGYLVVALGSVARYGILLNVYFFFGEGFVWDKALPATDLVLALVRPSFKREDALLATPFEVCFLLVLAICITSFRRTADYQDARSSDFSLHGMKQTSHTEGI